MNRSAKRIVTDGLPHERRHPLADAAGGGIRITTFVPLHFRKRGVKKVIVRPPEVDDPVVGNASELISPNQDSAFLKAMGRGYYWQHLLDTAAVADTPEIARREGIHRSTVNELLRLALLSPDIALATLQGTLPRTVSLEGVLRETVPLDWNEQRKLIASLG